MSCKVLKCDSYMPKSPTYCEDCQISVDRLNGKFKAKPIDLDSDEEFEDE